MITSELFILPRVVAMTLPMEQVFSGEPDGMGIYKKALVQFGKVPVPLFRIPRGDRIEICRRVVVNRQQQSPSRARRLAALLLPTLKRSHTDNPGKRHVIESILFFAIF
jgi:hypothetical protein